VLVAAVRVLERREEHPPSEEEIAQLLGWPSERVTFLMRGLVEAGILSRVETAYADRYRIVDHLKLEELPQDDKDVGIAADLKEFDEKAAQEQEKLEKLFAEGEEPEKQKRLASLDDEFSKFKGGKPNNPFDE